MLKSRTWVRRIASAFIWSTQAQKEMLIQLARLCVLYEDLQVEVAGAQAESLPELDRIDVETRRFYFVRRTLATLTEMEQAFHVLNGNAWFRERKENLPAEHKKEWDECIKFFAANHAFLKKWRNDTGGHFLQATAEYALDNIHYDTVGSIEVYRRGKGFDVKIGFAYEFVATALTKNKESHQTVKEFIEDAFGFLFEAARHAVNATQILINTEVVPRFQS